MPIVEWLKQIAASAVAVAVGAWFVSNEIHDTANDVRLELSNRIETVRVELSNKIDSVLSEVRQNGRAASNIQGQLGSVQSSIDASIGALAGDVARFYEPSPNDLHWTPGSNLPANWLRGGNFARDAEGGIWFYDRPDITRCMASDEGFECTVVELNWSKQFESPDNSGENQED